MVYQMLQWCLLYKKWDFGPITKPRYFPHGHHLLQDIIRCKASQNSIRCKTLLVRACTGSCGEGLSAEATRGPLAEGDRRFSTIF